MTMLGFTPLIDPMTAIYPELSAYWLLLAIPLVVAISVVYKGTRIKNLCRLPWETLTMTVQIVVLMVVAAGILDGLHWLWIRVL